LLGLFRVVFCLQRPVVPLSRSKEVDLEVSLVRTASDWLGWGSLFRVVVSDNEVGVVTGFGRGYFILAEATMDGGFFGLFQAVAVDAGDR
jgi:hypothetical protein